MTRRIDPDVVDRIAKELMEQRLAERRSARFCDETKQPSFEYIEPKVPIISLTSTDEILYRLEKLELEVAGLKLRLNSQH